VNRLVVYLGHLSRITDDDTMMGRHTLPRMNSRSSFELRFSSVSLLPTPLACSVSYAESIQR
jgi:hypothetical protein